ncbi:hypothetical protein LCGC14_2087870 [marine sediment metagenome]|uniref:Uncharacterized protein n=1 Tax=marine sediment metagenome TaxID=412755 RepID=A0A0F9EDH7_9ZZZZ
MKPTNFSESNKKLARPKRTTKEECGPLDVYSDGKYCISCWQGTFCDRLRFLFTNKIWLWVWFGQTQPPVKITTEYPFRKNSE